MLQAMVQVEVTRHLQALFPQLAGAPLDLDAATVADAIAKLEGRAPGVAFYICDELGRLRKHVNVFVNEDMVFDRKGLSDPLPPGSRVFIAQALSGGQ
jgi:sulfur carrier protein ThiS